MGEQDGGEVCCPLRPGQSAAAGISTTGKIMNTLGHDAQRGEPIPCQPLPGVLSGLSSVLAERHGVTSSLSLTVLLAAVGAAVGKSIRIEPAPGALPVRARMNLAIGSEHPGVGPLLRDVFAALLRRQERQAARWAGHDLARLREREEEMQRQRQRYLEHAVYPDAVHLAYFEEPLTEIRMARPQFLINPLPDQILAANQMGCDQATGVITTSAGVTSRLLDHWIKPGEGEAELNRIAADCHHRPLREIDTSGRLRLDVPDPAISLTLAVGAPDRRRLLTAPEFVQSGLAPTWLTADADRAEMAEAVLPTRTAAPASIEHWNALIEDLSFWRQSGRVWTCRPSDPAALAFHEFSRGVAGLAAGLPVAHLELASHWVEHAWRLALLLHVVDSQPREPVTGRTARMALTLMRWLIKNEADLLRSVPDPMVVFVRDCLIKQPQSGFTMSAAFELYESRRRVRGWPAVTRNKFSTAMADLVRDECGLAIRHDVRSADGKQKKGWMGLAPRPSVSLATEDGLKNQPQETMDYQV